MQRETDRFFLLITDTCDGTICIFINLSIFFLYNKIHFFYSHNIFIHFSSIYFFIIFYSPFDTLLFLRYTRKSCSIDWQALQHNHPRYSAILRPAILSYNTIILTILLFSSSPYQTKLSNGFDFFFPHTQVQPVCTLAAKAWTPPKTHAWLEKNHAVTAKVKVSNPRIGDRRSAVTLDHDADQ